MQSKKIMLLFLLVSVSFGLVSPVSANENYRVSLNGVPCHQAISEFQDKFNANIVVSSKYKDTLLHGVVNLKDIKTCLDSLSWILGCSWVKRDDIYYIGGTEQLYKVFPSCGYSTDIEQAFGADSVKAVRDKILVKGTEKEIQKLTDSVKSVLERRFIRFRLVVIKYDYDKSLQLGINIEKGFTYAANWVNMLQNVHPVTHLSMSVVASVQAEQAYYNNELMIDSTFGALSGEPVEFQSGKDIDRPVYSQADAAENRVVQSYNTQSTGLIVKISPYYTESGWMLRLYVEDSQSKSDTIKDSTSIKTSMIVKDKTPVLLGAMDQKVKIKQYKKGLPWLSDIPYLGYLFRVSEEIEIKRKICFYVQVL